MVQYIEKSALLAEIERLVNNYDKALDYEAALEDVRNFIDNIGDKEVDLEEEFNDFLDNVEGVPPMWYSDEQIEWAKDIARHFYELGLQAQKEEEPQVKESAEIQHVNETCKENGNSLTQEPVSEYLISVAKQYIDSHVFGNEEDKFTRSVLVDMFCSGAKWQAEQFEKNRLAACDRQAEEEAEIERDFVMGIIENEHRKPTYDDAIKYGMRLQKEQMMTKAIEAVVSQVPCSNEIILYNPSSVDSYYLPQEMDKLGLNKGDKVKLIIIKED